MGPEDFQAAKEEMDLQQAWDNDKARDANYQEQMARQAEQRNPDLIPEPASWTDDAGALILRFGGGRIAVLPAGSAGAARNEIAFVLADSAREVGAEATEFAGRSTAYIPCVARLIFGSAEALAVVVGVMQGLLDEMTPAAPKHRPLELTAETLRQISGGGGSTPGVDDNNNWSMACSDLCTH